MCHYILSIVLTVLMLGCTSNGNRSDEGKGEDYAPQPSDTLYTEYAAMHAYATQPERALLIIDSAEIVGNLTEVRADLLRAKVYSRTHESLQFDTAVLIAERLMQNDEVQADLDTQEETLEILLNACRLRQDNEEALHWATLLGRLYRERGEETEALRTDAEIGTFLMRIGQQPEGLAKIDSVVRRLDGKRKFNELDASIIALKRKAEVCHEYGLYGDMVPAAQRMLELLDDFEQHPADFHDGNIREPSDAERPNYIDFYRGKAYGYLAMAYFGLGAGKEETADAQEKARGYLARYGQTCAGQNVQGRFMIAPLLGTMGEYGRMLAIYDEVEQQLGDDTLNANYAEILRGRAEASEAQGRHAEASDTGSSPSHGSQDSNPDRQTPSTSNPAEFSDADLFAYLRDLIEREKLFLDPHFERQTLINRTGLSKERIGAAFSQGSGHERLTTFVRELRLEYAVRLMNEQPELTVEQVCQASGFANADTFTRNFRAKYGMTPTAYRGTLERKDSYTQRNL